MTNCEWCKKKITTVAGNTIFDDEQVCALCLDCMDKMKNLERNISVGKW